MENTVVIGAQWGDEGKAKITDLLAEKADLIIRYQGGCNAGHTVVAGGKTYKFHMIPSGILYDKTICFIGAGTVIHPESFERELNELKAEGVNFKNLKISPLASITMPYHIEIDGYSEAHSGKGKIGTTKKGIGPTYTDKAARIGFKIQDLYSFEALNEKIDMILPAKNKMLKNVYGLEEYTKDCILSLCEKYAELFKPYVCFDWQDMLNRYKDKKILFEGAQGVMLDVDYGTYPFVTSSHPGANGVSEGAGIGPLYIKEAIGIIKAYTTRVGSGPFPTELNDATGDLIRERGHEYGTVTERPRRTGWFDAVVVNQSRRMSSLTGISLMLLDVMSGFDTIKICKAYKLDGKEIYGLPATVKDIERCEPVYEELPGWKEDITHVKSFEELPVNCQNYIHKIEELVHCPVRMFSVGPDREQTVVLKDIKF